MTEELTATELEDLRAKGDNMLIAKGKERALLLEGIQCPEGFEVCLFVCLYSINQSITQSTNLSISTVPPYLSASSNKEQQR